MPIILLQQYAEVLCVNKLAPPNPAEWKIEVLTAESETRASDDKEEVDTTSDNGPWE